MFFDDLVLGTTAEIEPVNREKMMAFAYEYPW